jgi:hypothetical protein
MLSEGTEAAVCESPFKLSDRSFRHLTPASTKGRQLVHDHPKPVAVEALVAVGRQSLSQA